MLSFRNIAEFLKKVSSSSSNDGSKTAKQKPTGEVGDTGASNSSGSGTGTNVSAAAASSKRGGAGNTSDSPSSGKSLLYGRLTTADSSGGGGGLNTKDGDARGTNSPLSGMPSAFGDNTMFASSNILKGLAPNSSTQDILLHVQKVVQERREQLQALVAAEEKVDGGATKDESEQLLAGLSALDKDSTGKSRVHLASRNSLGNFSDGAERSLGNSPSLFSNVGPSLADLPPSIMALPGTRPIVPALKSPVTPSSGAAGAMAPAKDRMHKLQKTRAELIDALDVCLQEVPEEKLPSALPPNAAAATATADASANATEKTASTGAPPQPPSQPASLSRNDSVVLPSALTNALSDPGDAPEEQRLNAWEGTDNGTKSSAKSSVMTTPRDNADLGVTAASAETGNADGTDVLFTAFTHYEWRCLLLRIVNVLVSVDCAIFGDVRRRAFENLTPPTAPAATVASAAAPEGTAVRWERMPKAVPSVTANDKMNSSANALTPTRPSAASDAQQLLNSPYMSTTAPHERVTSLGGAHPSAGSAATTPKEVPLASGAAAIGLGGSHVPSPIARMRHALVENGIFSPDSRVDFAVTKEDKKILEELLTVACSLATWAIVKAILRQHLQVLRARAAEAKKTLIATTAERERSALELSLSGSTGELSKVNPNAGIAGTGGRPPRAPPAAAPPLAANANEGGSANDVAEEVSPRPSAGPTTSLYRRSIELDNYEHSVLADDTPYIDWTIVVEELAGWFGKQQYVVIAECALCASFLRDDGREMVMCMLQKPIPRKLLSNIRHHAEQLRRSDPSLLTGLTPSGSPATSTPAAGSPRVNTAGTVAAATGSNITAGATTTTSGSTGASTGGTAAPAAGTGAGTTTNTATANTANTTAAGNNTNANSSSVPPLTGLSKQSTTAAVANTTAAADPLQDMMDDPTLVMDDLVAQLETIYRKAVGDTWSRFLEQAIEAEVRNVSTMVATQRATAERNLTDEEDASTTALPSENSTAVDNSESHLPSKHESTAQPSLAPTPSALTMDYITDAKTLCRLATAYFFGSDTWSERKRERRFAVLYRSMRGRMEGYSESAATRRQIRRGTAFAISPTTTVNSTAAASTAEPRPLDEGNTLPNPYAPRGSIASFSATVVPPLVPSNARVSSAHSTAGIPTTTAGGTAATAAAVPPATSKFSVEDTSTRVPSTMSAAGASSLLNYLNPTPAGSVSRPGVPTSQLVAHQLLSSSASNAAGSAQGTPMAASLQASRDGGCSDVEAFSTLSGNGAGGGNGGPYNPNGSDLHSMSTGNEPSAAWLSYGFAVTPSEALTPPPEAQQSPNGQLNQTAPQPSQQAHQQQQRQPSYPFLPGFTPRRDEGNVPSSMDGSCLPSVSYADGSGPFGGPAQLPPPPQQLPFHIAHPVASVVLERIVNMSWSAALHRRGEQCLNAKPPRLDEAEQNAQEERLVAGVFGEFRARQRSLVSLINARLASGKSVEGLMNAQKHFKFEKKDWTSHSQTIFSAIRYLQSMVLLVRAQAACRVYGAVIETVQFVLPQATLCEQMLQVLAPRSRGNSILRFADCRSKLLRSYVYLLKECWLAHAAFNDYAKADLYFVKCAQALQMLRRRDRETELFAAYMERGSQLMKTKDYKRSVELFRFAVNVAKKSLRDADAASATTTTSGPAAATGAAAAAATAGGASGSAAAPSSGSAMTTLANVVSAAAANLGTKPGVAASQQQFHRNLHFRGAGSGSLTTAEEHNLGTSDASEDDLEFAWRVAESERMLALSYVTQAEHEVNVRERREELSNAVSNAYSSQRSLQRWQTKGGTPKRLLTAVPCSLIVICKGLLLLNQARKAALLLEPLIENKPNSAHVRPPMWREILHPTEDPYTAEDVVLRIYVCSVKIAVYMLYARCLAEFDGDRALRAMTQVDQLLQESDAWIYLIRTQLRKALEDVQLKDKSALTGLDPGASVTSIGASGGGAVVQTAPCTARNLELPRITGAAVAAISRATAAAADKAGVNYKMPAMLEDADEVRSTTKLGGGGADTVVSGASTAATAGTVGVSHTASKDVGGPLRIPSVCITNTTDNVTARMPLTTGSHMSPDYNSPEEAALRPRRVTAAAMEAGGNSSVGPSREDLNDEEERSRQSISAHPGVGSLGADMWSYGSVSSGANFSTSPTTASAAGQAVVAASRPLALRIQMESASECMTALFALREGKSHIRKAFRDAFIVSGDAHSLIKNWEEALKSYSHALVISMSEVEAASAAAQSRRRVSQQAASVGAAAATPRISTGAGNSHNQQDGRSPNAAPTPASTNAMSNNGNNTSKTGGGNSNSVGDAKGTNGGNAASQCWNQVVPLDEEFFVWDEEDVLIADNLVNRELTASTAAKDLRAVVADEERMDSRACESIVLSKLANVYRALEKPTTAIHYHNLVLDYANECHDKLLAYNSMLSLARLYTAAGSAEEARDMWAKVSDLAKEYEDKEVSRETKRNIVAGQEAAGMYLDVVKTAEELEKLATGEEGEDAAADRRFALEALANANLQLGQYDACIAALDSREKVQEKSAEWNGRLLSMRAKARMGLNKPAEAIKVMQSWAAKARNLGNWVELGKANSALSAAYASENENLHARNCHVATLNAFALAETLNEDCQNIALDSARWLVHYAYLDDATVQIDPALTYTGGCLTSDSEASGGDFHYGDSGLCNSSGDLGVMLAKEEELRRSSSSLLADANRMRGGSGSINDDDDDDDFFNGGGGGQLSNSSMFGMRYPTLNNSLGSPDRSSRQKEREDEDGNVEADGDDDNAERKPLRDASATLESGDAAANDDESRAEGDEGPSLRVNGTPSNASLPSDPGCATQPPSLTDSMNVSTGDFTALVDANDSGSSAGQSDAADNNDVVSDAHDEEFRRRREVDEALRTMDDEAEPLAQRQESLHHDLFFNMESDADPIDTKELKAAAEAKAGLKSSASATNSSTNATASGTLPTPTVTTAAMKTSTNAAAAGVGASKSATSNYVPPPTALANVSICSRPAAAAAGTDVLEMPVGGGHSGSDVSTSGTTSGGSGGSPVLGSSGANPGMRGPGPLDRQGAAAVNGTLLLGRADGEDGPHERKPATVHTTYYRGAIEMMETAAQLLLVPRHVSRLVVPYSPAEAVDFALIAHPHSLFVFYFAEYTTEYGAQCDVVVRPPSTAGFMKMRAQISLKEYHSKDVVNSLLTTLSAEASVAGGNNGDHGVASSGTSMVLDATSASAASSTHPFGGAMARAAAGGTGSTAASPTLSTIRPDALRAALDEESRSCLRNLHADAWQPILDRMTREKVNYRDAETVVIMPDISLLHLPFAGFLPSPDYGGEEAPLGEQFTLIVTPSLTHFVYHSMSKQSTRESCGVLDPNARRYIFVPYDALHPTGTSSTSHSPIGPSVAATTSIPASPQQRPPQPPATATKAGATAGAPSASTTTVTSTATGKQANVGSAAASSTNPLASPALSVTETTASAAAGANNTSSAVVGTATNANSTTRRESTAATVEAPQTLGAAAATTAVTPGTEDDDTFDGLLRTWRVHRGSTRKELIHAFTDSQTRALIFLSPIDQQAIRVADGAVTLPDIMHSLQSARPQKVPASAGSGGNTASVGAGGNANKNAAAGSNGINGTTTTPGITASNATSLSATMSTAGGAAGGAVGAPVSAATTSGAVPVNTSFSAPPVPQPPLCSHMDLLVLTADRSLYTTVNNAGTTANMCMSLGLRRVLRLNLVHGLTPNDEQRAFIARYLTNLKKTMRWSLSNPYAVALRTTIAETRRMGMSSNTWGAFTLVGSA